MITRTIFDFAARQPDKTALVHDGRVFSYDAFATRIATARGFFARMGCLGPGVAALALTNILDFWSFSLALRSLGLTTVAVPSPQGLGELGLPDLRFVVASAAESWPGLAEACESLGVGLLSVASLDGEAPLGLDADTTYGGHILQTSGTTGAHKKVLIDPSFEEGFMRHRRQVAGIGQDAVVACFSFGGWNGAGYKSPVSTWFAGGTVTIDQGPKTHLSLFEPGVTHATIIPGLLAAMLAEPEDAFPRRESLRLTVTSGTVTQHQIDQTKARITPLFFNRIGATEVGSFASTRLNTPDDHRWHQLASDVEIVDEHDQPVPIGETGRVRVSTAGGPTGYLHDPQTTRAFFKDGYFYPGDLAVFRADGRMALQGRVTGVINVQGQKISPEPIEDALRAALGVTGACLVSAQDAAGEEALHLVIETPAPLDLAQLTAVLQRELGGFPGVHVHYAPALPRNDMGKMLRQAIMALATGTG